MLEFLGTGSAFNTKKGNNAAFRKNKENLFMIDCGSEIFFKIKENNFTENIKKFELFATHTHGDHVGSLGDFIFYTFFCIEPILESKIVVYSVKDSKVKEVLDLMGCVDGYHYKNEHLEEGKEKEVMQGKMIISPIKTEHYPNMNSYGLEIKVEGKKIFYSADANRKTYDYIDLNEYDVLYLDVSQNSASEQVHMSMRQLIELTKETDRKKIHCMHLDESFKEKEALEKGFEIAKNIYE